MCQEYVRFDEPIMRRTERLFALAEHLRGRRTGVTADTLAERFSVTVRTVYRDLDTLRAASLPVSAERGRGGGLRPRPQLQPAAGRRQREVEGRAGARRACGPEAAAMRFDDSLRDVETEPGPGAPCAAGLPVAIKDVS